MQIAFTPLGVVLALVFVGLPFVVRTVQPVLASIDPEVEEAAAVLGASRLRDLLPRDLPAVLPALLTGFALAFARALGEYGSVVFISGNMPLQDGDRAAADRHQARAVRLRRAPPRSRSVMLAASFFMLLVINALRVARPQAR